MFPGAVSLAVRVALGLINSDFVHTRFYVHRTQRFAHNMQPASVSRARYSAALEPSPGVSR